MMAKQAFDEAVSFIDQLDKAKASESATVLQFLQENINSWKDKKNKKASLAQANFFSQQDSEAQFINQDDLDDEYDDENDD